MKINISPLDHVYIRHKLLNITKKKGVAEDEMVRLHHQINGQESEQISGDSEGQGSPVC